MACYLKFTYRKSEVNLQDFHTGYVYNAERILYALDWGQPEKP